jgi:hypothetical protein
MCNNPLLKESQINGHHAIWICMEDWLTLYFRGLHEVWSITGRDRVKMEELALTLM